VAGFISLPFFEGGFLSFILAFVVLEGNSNIYIFFQFEGLTLEDYLTVLWRYRGLPHYLAHAREKDFFYITKLKAEKIEEVQIK